MSAALNSDPPENERVWYRNRETADRGFLVTREGRPAIRYDRPTVDQYSHQLERWERIVEAIPKFNAVTIGQIAYEADRKLCLALGLHDRYRREWLDMTERQRKNWIKDGPNGEPHAALYKAIKGALEGVV